MTSEIGFVPLYYMPPVSVFRSMNVFASLDFQTDRPYGKMSFRNRCIIAGSQGMQTLSIPIKGGRGVRVPYQEVIIDHRMPWHLHHWRAIYSAYGRSPWFEFYAADLEQLYSSPPDRLVDWNLRCLEWLYRKLGLTFPELKTNVINEREKNPGPEVSASFILSPQQFQQGCVDDSPSYLQVFQEKNGFFPNLSMLDFILCAGPRNVRDWTMNA
jgi:hypothetical protein